MASRQASSDAYNWPHPQESNLPPARPYSNQSSSYPREQSQSFMHSNAPSYMHSRQAPPQGGMTYGMAPPIQSHHVQDPAAGQSDSSAYMSQPHMGQYGSSVPQGFAYGSQFYGGPQGADAMSQQQQHYYGGHHAQMEPNGHGHPMYGNGPMSPEILGPNGQYHHGDGVMGGGGYGGLQAVGVRPKRKQVKNACVNCQKACKKCDEGRPCGRCVKYGLTDTCQDSARKERRRGVKRGPYKRRATTGSQPNSSGAMGIPMYGRDGHISPSGRAMDGTSSAPAETNLSSPGFGNQSLAPRQGVPMGMPGNNGAWQPSSSPSMRSAEEDRDARSGRYMPHSGGPNSYYSGYENQEGGPSPYDRSSSAPIPGPGSLVLSPIGSLNRFQQQSQLPSLNAGSSRPLASPSSGGFLNSGPPPLAHHRLHSDSSLTTVGTSSPRTPLNGQGGSDYALMSPPVKNGTYVPPQPTVPQMSSFLAQDQSRPFPLKMPKVLQRPRLEERRSGTGFRGANSSLGLA